MNNFIFKSSKGLIKNSSSNLDNLMRKLDLVLNEQRHQRSDLKDIKLMINKLLITEHLQKQVDDFYKLEPPTEEEGFDETYTVSKDN